MEKLYFLIKDFIILKFIRKSLSINILQKPLFMLLNRLFCDLTALFPLRKVMILSITTLLFSSKVLADYTVPSGPPVDASTIAGQSGVLTINGTLNVQGNVSLLNFTSVIINGPTGQIYWTGNYDLKFASGISFVINNAGSTGGLQPTAGNGNGATRLYIGNVFIAVQSDHANNGDFSFEEFNGMGGLPAFTLSSSTGSPVCYGTTITATLTPPNNTYSYDCSWSVNSGGSISPANNSNFNTAKTATVTAVNSTSVKIYTITCKVYKHGDSYPLLTKTLNITVNPIPAPVIVTGGGTSLCSNSTTLTAGTGGSGNIYFQGTSSNGTSTAIPGNPQSVSNAGTYYFRAEASGCWGAQGSAVVSFHNLWTGNTSSDWNTASNWSDNQLPSTTCPDVYIPSVTRKPVLSNTPVATIKNLQILSGATLTVNGTGVLQIAGSITNNGTFDAGNGTLVLNGTSTQTIAGSMFKNRNLKNLTISNDVDVANTLNDTLNILGSLSFGSSTAQLNTGDNIALKSSDTATANVGALAAGNTITGKVIVERYINLGTGSGQHAKTWEFLAVPTTGQSVFNSWMEGGSKLSTGYGTQVTGPGGNGAGFDMYSVSPSMKYYDPSNSLGWTGITNTGNSIYNSKGYMLFVRGDRSVNGTTVTTPNNTILRTKGTLFTGDVSIPLAGDNSFASIGNPYASAIDMRNVTQTTGSGFFYLWNPNSIGGYGYGKYETYFFDGVDYVSIPSLIPNNFIQSGQAFFVQTMPTAGSINFTEASKSNGSTVSYFRPQGTSGRIAQLRTNLYSVNADSAILDDGTLQQFSGDYSNAIDRMDAKKMYNSSENLSVKSGGKYLVLERRQMLGKSDTVFFNLTGVKAQSYRLVFTAQNLSARGLQGFIEDTYLHTQTPLNLEGSTTLNFSVTSAAGSFAANRFRIVFAPMEGPLPVTFVSVNATLKNADITVAWKVENESNMKQYEVEQSMNGSAFNQVAILSANNTGVVAYSWLDKNATPGYHYYRIKSIDINGSVTYSPVVKVWVPVLKQDIAIYPNPVTDGIIHLQLENQPEGKYIIRLLNKLGQVMLQKQINHPGGNSTELIQPGATLAKGIYQLEVALPDGSVKVLKAIY
ncbi:MAG: T9SS type A sorting domain-containing protein [Bacteroidota bacterium]|nr:T9SS type A sorting domain-containing protein [Bacteroidota bacterium]